MLGIGLYQASVIYAGGLLAAITVPQSYFEWFGHSHSEEALALLHLGGYALPIALLVAGGTLSVQRLLSPSGRDALYGVLAGLVLCAAFWLVAGLLAVPQDRLVCAASLFQGIGQHSEAGRIEMARGQFTFVVCRLSDGLDRSSLQARVKPGGVVVYR